MGYRLLVVAGGNEALQGLQGQLGADIDIALVESANDALWEVRSTPPHAIIANMDLPDMSGLDMAEILPNFGVSTRVILWSGTPNPEAQLQAGEVGVYRFLSGPLSLDQLRSEIAEAFKDLPIEQQEPEQEEPPPPPVRAPAPPSREPDVPYVERIVRPQPAAERTEVVNEPPTPPERPTRRIIPNPDPPYQPPARKATPAPRPADRPSGGLASRARLAQAAPSPPPTPPPAAAAHAETPAPQQRRTGTLVMTADNLAPITRMLSDLSQVLGAQCTLVTDRAGMIMAQHGTTDGLPMMILLPLLSTSFSTAGEVARWLHEEDATTLYMHDGVRYGLYCFDVLQRYLLVVVFDKTIASTRIGSVWVEARGAIRKLKEALI